MSRLTLPEISVLQAEVNRMSERTIGELARTSLEEDEDHLVSLGMDRDDAARIVHQINRLILGPK